MKIFERFCYIVVIFLLLVMVWAFGKRLEEHQESFSAVESQLIKQQEKLKQVEAVLYNEGAAMALYRSLKARNIDIQSLSVPLNKD